MADSAVAITAGSGTNIDTRTEGTNNNHRQVIVIGDPATNAGVAPVDVTAGLKVDLGADNDVRLASAVIPAATTMQNAATANGNGTSLDVNGYSTAILNVTASVAMGGGTTINFEASVDDTTWVAITALSVGTTTLATTTIATGDFAINAAGYKSLRARISAYSAGTITVKGYAVAGSAPQSVVTLATGTNSVGQVTANAGTNLNTSLLALETGGNLAAAATSLAVLDDWDETDRCKVNPIAGQAGVQGGSGTVSALTQRVVLATDVALPAGTNNIGDVDVLTLPGVAGTAANGAAPSGNPVSVAVEARSTVPTAVDDGDVIRAIATLTGKQVVLPHAIPAATWVYAAAAGGLVTTGGVTAKAAAGSGVRNYVTRAQIINSHQSTSTEVVIRDGASGTVMWRGWAQAGGGGCSAKFDPPLRGTANTLIEIAEVTQTATAGVLVNLQGYEAAE